MNTARPALGALHCPAPSDRWLVPRVASDAWVHARLLHNLRARTLHGPLLRVIGDAAGSAAADAPAAAAHRAFAALLPGNPKPVANLTRDPVVVALLLRCLAGEAVADELAFACVTGLVFARASAVSMRAYGPRVVRHVETRRALPVADGAVIDTIAADLYVDDALVDPWGSAWQRHTEVGPFCLSPACAGYAARLDASWQALASTDVAAAEVEAYLPWLGAADEVALGATPCSADVDARALVLAAAKAKLGLLRLLDPLTEDPSDEARFIEGARRVSAVAWGLGAPDDLPAIDVASRLRMTTFGAGLRDELVRVRDGGE